MLRFGTVRTRRNNETTFLALGPANSDSCDGEEFTLAGWVSDCHDVVTSLGLDRFHVVGGSLGGTIALCLAGELPERALSVTAMGSNIRDEPERPGERAGDVTTLLDAGTVDEMFAVVAANAVAPGSPDSLVTTVKQLTNAHGEPVIRGVWQAAKAADATAWVSAVRCLALVVSGELDPSCGPDAGRKMASSVGGRHEVLPGVGHLPMLENAPAVLDLLVPHLDSAEVKAGVA